MTLMSSSFGVSSMGLSSICARSGILLFVFQLLLATFINLYSYKAFLFLTSKFELKNFQELSKLMLGKLQMFAIFSLLISNIGNMVGNMLIFIKYLQGLFKKLNLMSVEPSLNENMIQITIVSFFILPLILKRQLKDIFIVSYLSIVIMLFFVFFVIYQFLGRDISNTGSPPILINPKHFVSNYSYLFFCFAGH